MGVKIYRKHLKSGLPSNKSRNSEICAGHQAKATQTQTPIRAGLATFLQRHSTPKPTPVRRVIVYQTQIPKHQDIDIPLSKSYPNPNSHTGRSRYVPSVLVSPLHTQTHTRMESDSLPNTNSETPGYRHTVKQKLPKPKLPYGQVSLRPFGPSLAFAHPNPHPYGYIVPKSEWDNQEPWLHLDEDDTYGEENSLGPKTAPLLYAGLKEILQKLK